MFGKILEILKSCPCLCEAATILISILVSKQCKMYPFRRQKVDRIVYSRGRGCKHFKGLLVPPLRPAYAPGSSVFEHLKTRLNISLPLHDCFSCVQVVSEENEQQGDTCGC